MFGGWRAYHGYMDIGALITFFLLANQFFAPIAIIGNQYNEALVAMAGAERVFRLVAAKPDREDAEDAQDLPDPRAKPAGSSINYSAGRREHEASAGMVRASRRRAARA